MAINYPSILGPLDIGEFESNYDQLLALIAAKASASHVHTIANVTDLQAALDVLTTAIAGKASTSHVHTTANVTGLDDALDDKLDADDDSVTDARAIADGDYGAFEALDGVATFDLGVFGTAMTDTTVAEVTAGAISVPAASTYVPLVTETSPDVWEFQVMRLGTAAAQDAYVEGAPTAAASSSGAVTLNFATGPVALTMSENITATTISGLALYAREELRIVGHASNAYTFEKESGWKWPTWTGATITIAATRTYTCTVYQASSGVYEWTIGDGLA